MLAQLEGVRNDRDRWGDQAQAIIWRFADARTQNRPAALVEAVRRLTRMWKA